MSEQNAAFMLGVKAEQARIIELLNNFDADNILQWEVELVSLIPEITGAR